MKISRDNRMTIADLALRLLARGICAASMFDKRVASDVATLGDGFSFAVCAGLDERAPAVRLAIENGRFIRTGMENDSLGVSIRFKDVTGLMPVITGKKSIETAFAQHRMMVFGNINQAVILVRIISITEAYIFPKLILKKAMRRVPKRQVPGLFVYIALLFFGIRKPSNKIVTDLDEQIEDVEEQEGEIKDELETIS